MNKTAVFTVTARNYHALAATLGQSLASSNANLDFFIFSADGLKGLEEQPLVDCSVDVASLFGPRFPRLAFQYNVTELCTAVKPTVFKHLLAQGYAKVLYLDPDICVYGGLEPVLDALDRRAICVTPHILECKLLDEDYPEYHHLFEGIFNFGFVGVADHPQARRFLDWWELRLADYCFSDSRDGLHTDQKWGDYLPTYFGDQLTILKHPGANVSHWNLVERMLKLGDGGVRVNDQPLLFFHFSGFDYLGSGLVKRGEVNTKVTPGSPLHWLSSGYRDRLRANGHDRNLQIEYGLSRYRNGALISDFHRRMFRVIEDKPVDPFDSFFEVMRRARLVSTKTMLKRPPTRYSMPDFSRKLHAVESLCRLALRLLGPERYELLVRAFEYLGRRENHVFLLKR